MNEQDFRDACAMLFGLGMIIAYKDNHTEDVLSERAFKLADAMLEARRVKEEPQGIVAIKKKRSTR
jgi:hypothetical protein